MFEWAEKEYPLNNKNIQVVEEDNLSEKKGYFSYRNITEATYKTYNCETSFDGDTPIAHHYVYPSGKVKTRVFPKTFHSDSGMKTNEFFGMNLFNGGSSKSVVITEGELDAMSVFQMLQGRIPAIALPSATPSKTLLENCKKWLDTFDKYYLSIDTDDKAQGFANSLMQLYPGKVYRIHHDKYKDANEFLMAGAAVAFQSAFQNAKLYTPDNILNNSEGYLALFDKTQDYTYIPTNIPELDEKILGLMQGQFTVILAETGIGKTEFMRKLEYNFIKNYPDITFATWHLEETKLRSLLGLVSYELNDNLTRKDLVEEKGRNEDVKQAIKKITENGHYIQFSLHESSSVEDLVEQIRVLKAVYGCQYIFFEPIQDVLSISDEKEKESKLASLSIQLSKMASDMNIGIVTIAHTNDDGEPKYCKMIAQRAGVRIVLKRDTESGSEVEKNTLHLYVTKNRPCSNVGEAGKLIFNKETFVLENDDVGF